jgi:hypothetical protein
LLPLQLRSLNTVDRFERGVLITELEMSQTQNTERAVKLARESIELLDAGHTEVRVVILHFPGFLEAMPVEVHWNIPASIYYLEFLMTLYVIRPHPEP